MSAHIDWLTAVLWRDVDQKDWSVNAAYLTAIAALVDALPTFIEIFGNPSEWEIVRPRAPYSYARRSHDATRTLYVHPLAAHFSLEVSGTYCQKITQRMPEVLEAFGPNLSRLDVAVDMECDVTPMEFDAKTDKTRVKTHSVMQSSTGQTIYLGSRSSERFARVYRYNPPHPRAHLLRAEFQLRGDYAKALSSAVNGGTSLEELANGLGAHFGFNHPVWTRRPAQSVKLKVVSHPQSGATIAWLTGTVAPLLRRLEREGKLDVAAWVETYVKNITD